MSEVVSASRDGAVGLIALNNPPVNAASAALRTGIAAALDMLAEDPDVRVIALYGEGRAFIAGADIREFGKPPVPPLLPDVCNRLERCGKPVISVLHGAALGGGLEVALATHLRVAIPGVSLGFPEVTLGVIPGAGGTQRAPRLIGVEPALNLIVSGKRIGAEEALALGLVDRVAPGEPKAVALAAARDVLAGDLATRRTGDIPVHVAPETIDRVRQEMSRSQGHLFSPLQAVEAVAAAAGSLAEGLAEERARFQACIQSPQRAGLIHAFFAERAVAKIPEADATPRAITRVGVIGTGTMGSGIATACLLAGLPVCIMDKNADALDRGRTTVEKALDGAVGRGKLSAVARTATVLETTQTLDALRDCDLIIEAAFEDMAVKRAIFTSLGEIAKEHAVLATNTSYLDVDAIAAASGRPEDVLGLHFFSPAHIMKLLEVVVADKTAPDIVATGFTLAKRLKKIAVRARVCDGFIGNRIMTAYRKASDFIMLDGAPVDQIDRAIRDFGFKMGPFEMSDLAGLDIGWAARKRLAATRDPAARYHGAVADHLCEAGHFGRKTGLGFYDHRGDDPVVNADLAPILAEIQAREGIAPRDFHDEEIVARYMTAMVAEAARVVEERIALRPIDVDAVFLFGYGFPRWKGGPLHYADTVGATELVRRIQTYAKDDAAFWTCPALLTEMAQSGRTFADLNRES